MNIHDIKLENEIQSVKIKEHKYVQFGEHSTK